MTTIDYHTRITRQVEAFVKNNSLYHESLNLVMKSQNRNTIKLFNYDLSHSHRKAGVLVLSLACSLRIGTNSKPPIFAIRRLAVYFGFFSLLLCRENLNPYFY